MMTRLTFKIEWLLTMMLMIDPLFSNALISQINSKNSISNHQLRIQSNLIQIHINPIHISSSTGLLFKRGEQSNDEEDNWFSSWKQKLSQTFSKPTPDTGNRYHIRIKDLSGLSPRHVSMNYEQ